MQRSERSRRSLPDGENRSANGARDRVAVKTEEAADDVERELPGVAAGTVDGGAGAARQRKGRLSSKRLGARRASACTAEGLRPHLLPRAHADSKWILNLHATHRATELLRKILVAVG